MVSLGWLLLFATAIRFATAATLYVSPDSNLTPGNCSISSPCNLSTATSMVAPGDTMLFISDGNQNYSFPLSPTHIQGVAFDGYGEGIVSQLLLFGEVLALEEVSFSIHGWIQFQSFQSLTLRDVQLNTDSKVTISNASSVHVSGNILSDGVLGGSAAKIQGVAQLTIFNATFMGVLVSLTNVQVVVIMNSVFSNYSLSLTGSSQSVTVTDAAFLNGVSSSANFIKSKAPFRVGGGLAFLLRKCESATFHNVKIESSTAQIGGGAFWDDSAIPGCVPSGGITYVADSASVYGNNAASWPYQLVAGYNSPPAFIYAGLQFDVRLTVKDYFNNTVLPTEPPLPTLFAYSVVLSCIGCIMGEYSVSETDKNGVAYFPGVFVTANGTHAISITATSRSIPGDLPLQILVMNLTLHCGLNQAIDVTEANYGQCSVCPLYSYCFVNGGTCQQCPSIGRSPCVAVNDSGLVIAEHYWPAPSYQSPSQVIDCYWQSSAICQATLCNFSNQTGNLVCQESCSNGYEDFACSRCSPDYYRITTGCLPCSTSRSFRIMSGIICATILIVTMFALTFFGEQASKIYLILELLLLMLLFFFDLAEMWFIELVALLSITYLLLLFIRGKKAIHSTAGLLKITVFFVQTSYVILGPLFPSSFSWLLSMLSHAVPRIHVIGLECLSSIFTPGTWIQLLFVWLFPLLLMIPVIGIMLLRRIRVVLLPRVSDGIKQRWQEELFHSMIWILNTVHFEVCVQILSNFTCRSFHSDEVSRIFSYPWIECSGNDYANLSRTAILGAVLYIGVWPLFVILTVIYPIIIHNSHELPWYLIIFQEGYRKERSWYEAIWLLRRLIIAMIVSLIPKASDSSSALIIVLACSTLLHLHLKPFSTIWQNRVESIALIAIMIGLSILSLNPSPVLTWFGLLFPLSVSLIIVLIFASMLWPRAAQFLSKLSLLNLFIPEQELHVDDESQPLLESSHLIS